MNSFTFIFLYVLIGFCFIIAANLGNKFETDWFLDLLILLFWPIITIILFFRKLLT